MPELPEVETVRRVLCRRVLDRRIEQVEVLERRLRMPVALDFASRLEGRTIRELRRRAKYLIACLDDDCVWIVHLGMSGKLIAVPPDRPRERHDHLVLRLAGPLELRFHDPRRFGLAVVLAPNELAAWPPFRSLGPDPLVDGLDPEDLWHRVHASGRSIKDLLMDQGVVAGLGNIYVNEVLARAGVRPAARACRLPRATVERIASEIPLLLQEAVRWCGTTFSDYRDGDDRAGEFQRHLRVYGRTGEPCRSCGTAIRRSARGNRGTFYCPRCQK